MGWFFTLLGAALAAFGAYGMVVALLAFASVPAVVIGFCILEARDAIVRRREARMLAIVEHHDHVPGALDENGIPYID